MGEALPPKQLNSEYLEEESGRKRIRKEIKDLIYRMAGIIIGEPQEFSLNY